MGRRRRAKEPDPADFGDILGHTAVLDRLRRALATDSLHHAYLFEGPAGTGKTRVAQRLAMAACCEQPELAARPCGTCGSCTRILAGTHPDVIVVGPDPDRAAPVITVAQIRELVGALAFHRYNARRRTVIIEPAEAMQDPAANALLKTLEEPADGTGFVLIATSATSLLPTIVSRCQRVRFGGVPAAELAFWLDERGVDEADLLARLSLGSPGAALAMSGRALKKRRDLRDKVIGAAEGPLDALYKTSQDLTKGGRAQWRDRVDLMLDVVEDLLRDAVVASTGAGELLYPDTAEVAARWGRRMWPDGVARSAKTVADNRERLLVYVNGRAAVDTVLTRLWTELALGPGARPR